MATWTEADVAALRAAVASGVLSVSFDGPPRRTITYQSLQAMADQLARMETSISRSSGTSSCVQIVTSKGL